MFDTLDSHEKTKSILYVEYLLALNALYGDVFNGIFTECTANAATKILEYSEVRKDRIFLKALANGNPQYPKDVLEVALVFKD